MRCRATLNIGVQRINTRTRWRMQEVEERMMKRERNRTKNREWMWEIFSAYFEGTYVSSKIVNNNIVLHVVDKSLFFSFRSSFLNCSLTSQSKANIYFAVKNGRRSWIFDFYRCRFDQPNLFSRKTKDRDKNSFTNR